MRATDENDADLHVAFSLLYLKQSAMMIPNATFNGINESFRHADSTY